MKSAKPIKSTKPAETKPTTKPKESKPKFDTDAFVFKTDISKIEEWLQRMLDDLDDPDVEYPTYDEQYLIIVMINEINFCKNNEITQLLTNAKENAIMGLYRR